MRSGQAVEADFLAPDFRGHGRSPGRRGVVRKYEEFVDDLRIGRLGATAATRFAGFRAGPLEWRSGVLRLALDPPNGVAGVIVSNPSIRLAMPVPAGKVRLGKLLLSLAPWITLRADTPSAWLTRDSAMQDMYRSDGLRHNRISPPFFFGMVAGGEMLLARAGEFRLPILVLIGGQDPVINPQATREFHERVGSDDKTLLIYPKMLHEPFNELGREQVFDDLSRWLAERIEAG